MDKKLLVISGRKQSGKSSLCNFLHGFTLRENKVISNFDLDEKGQLIVPAAVQIEDKVELKGGIFDINRAYYDPNVFEFMYEIVWPHIQKFSLADSLKASLNIIFGIPMELLYGTDEQKNTLTHIKWKDILSLLPTKMKNNIRSEGLKDNFLTIRDLLKVFGTEVCRKFDPGCWLRECKKYILTSNTALSVNDDTRFVNEIEGFISLKDEGIDVKTVRLTRRIDDDDHDSEKSLDDYDKWDKVIDNKDMIIKEKNYALLEAMIGWGWIRGEIVR